MEDRLINDIKEIENYLEERNVKSKIIDRLYLFEYKTFSKKENKKTISLNVEEDENKIKYKNSICNLKEDATNQEIYKALLKVLSLNVINISPNKLLACNGFTDTKYTNKSGVITQYEDVNKIYLNLGVLEFLTRSIYIDIIKKPYDKKILGNNVLSDSYIASEITRILNFIIFETEDTTKLLKLYLKNDLNLFLKKIYQKIGLEKQEVFELYEIATIFLTNTFIKKTMPHSDNYDIKLLKTFFKKSYEYARNKKIKNAESFFAIEFSKEIISYLV